MTVNGLSPLYLHFLLEAPLPTVESCAGEQRGSLGGLRQTISLAIRERCSKKVLVMLASNAVTIACKI